MANNFEPPDWIPDPVARRFWSHVEKRADGCWVWHGPLHGGTGYGRFTVDRQGHLAHRLAYELLKGPIPRGLCLDHGDCPILCVNPAHTEPVTRGENSRRGRSANAAKTHCPHGHPYSGDNLFLGAKGERKCRACSRRSSRAYQRQRRKVHG